MPLGLCLIGFWGYSERGRHLQKPTFRTVCVWRVFSKQELAVLLSGEVLPKVLWPFYEQSQACQGHRPRIGRHFTDGARGGSNEQARDEKRLCRANRPQSVLKQVFFASIAFSSVWVEGVKRTHLSYLKSSQSIICLRYPILFPCVGLI